MVLQLYVWCTCGARVCVRAGGTDSSGLGIGLLRSFSLWLAGCQLTTCWGTLLRSNGYWSSGIRASTLASEASVQPSVQPAGADSGPTVYKWIHSRCAAPATSFHSLFQRTAVESRGRSLNSAKTSHGSCNTRRRYNEPGNAQTPTQTGHRACCSRRSVHQASQSQAVKLLGVIVPAEPQKMQVPSSTDVSHSDSNRQRATTSRAPRRDCDAFTRSQPVLCGLMNLLAVCSRQLPKHDKRGTMHHERTTD